MRAASLVRCALGFRGGEHGLRRRSPALGAVQPLLWPDSYTPGQGQSGAGATMTAAGQVNQSEPFGSWQSLGGGGLMPAVLALLCPAGCSQSPSQDIMESFLPAWILCSVIGIAAAVLCRAVLDAARLSKHMLARRYCADESQNYERCILCQKNALGLKWHKSFRVAMIFRVVASSYKMRLAYAEGYLSEIAHWSLQPQLLICATAPHWRVVLSLVLSSDTKLSDQALRVDLVNTRASTNQESHVGVGSGMARKMSVGV